jgi:hypothetical protein
VLRREVDSNHRVVSREQIAVDMSARVSARQVVPSKLAGPGFAASWNSSAVQRRAEQRQKN